MAISLITKCCDVIMEGWTSIAVRKDTHKKLLELGKKGDSFDDIIRRGFKMDNGKKTEPKEDIDK